MKQTFWGSQCLVRWQYISKEPLFSISGLWPVNKCGFGAFWIPAFAGMTDVCGNDRCVRNDGHAEVVILNAVKNLIHSRGSEILRCAQDDYGVDSSTALRAKG